MIQPGLPGLNPVCSVCMFHLEGTCDGAERPEDLFAWPNKGRPDCTNPARQVEYSVNLAQYRPEPVLNIPPVPRLPLFIPVLESGLPKDLSLPPGELYGVGLRTVVRESGRLRTTSAAQLRTLLRLPPDARLCLSCSCDDPRIEKLWRRSLELDTWRGLADLCFEFVTGMTFSVWTENPRFTQKYNIERNFASVDFFASLGVPVVPILFCPRDADLRQAGSWLRERPSMETVGGLAQFHKSNEAFTRFLDDFARIRDAAGREIHLLVIGCATQEKIHEAYQRFPGATIMTNKPIRKGNSGHGFSEDLASGEQFEQTKEALIQDNIALFSRICKGFRDGANLLQLATVSPIHSTDPRQLLLPGIGLRTAESPTAPQAVRRSAKLAP